jgi:biopolymer transport protein ExbD
MPLKTEPLDEPGINLTSMLDVVMLLIIFFMIGTRFSEEERQTDIEVPNVADSSALAGTPDEIVVNVAEDGKVFVKGEPHTAESLLAMLQVAHAGFPSQGVIIRGDGRCRYQQIMDAFSTCKEAGIRKISVAHQPRKSGS